jgi:glycosidase
MRHLVFSLALLSGLSTSNLNALPILYPSNWWVGMHHNRVEIMMHDSQADFSKTTVSVRYPGLRLHAIRRPSNSHYLFVEVSISAKAKPGVVPVMLTDGQQTRVVQWPLHPRRSGNGTTFARGISQEDFIYLIMPDRFSNGDPTNDKLPGLLDQTLNRDSIYHRHGGDLQGIIRHLDYLQELGVTALWMTPVIQNDMPSRTEHGYAFTNHYKIEPRLGGETAYLELSDALRKRGMKLVQDAVYNHVGSYHFTVLDPPMPDWLHQWPTFTNTTYKDQPLMDPYAAASDVRRMSDGWFVPTMPDLNQNNPHVANFLIQHAIWSVETWGVDAWRIDTYIYNDLPFMNTCNAALLKEYPKIGLFGETWVHGVANQAFFTQNKLSIPFKSNLPGVTDFQTNLYGISKALNEPFGWTEGVNRLYTTLSNDFLYAQPANNVNFLDNHDLSRFFTQVGENTDKMKVGIAWLLTCRGIPQWYYGTEILMKGNTWPADGWVRLDFPGGWPGDSKNAFTGSGLSDEEKNTQQLVRKLANFRKTCTAITHGKMTQYVPENGLYTYVRYHQNQVVACIMNTDTKGRDWSAANYPEHLRTQLTATDVVTEEILSLSRPITLPPMSMRVLLLNTQK